jgi:hypothetical protein
MQTAETQTALAIDPQTSVKLSFISAGLSSSSSFYGNTIEDTFYHSHKFDQRSTQRFHDTAGRSAPPPLHPVTPATGMEAATGKSPWPTQDSKDYRQQLRQQRDHSNQHIISTPPRGSDHRHSSHRHPHPHSPRPPSPPQRDPYEQTRHVRYSTPNRSERYHRHLHSGSSSSGSDDEASRSRHESPQHQDSVSHLLQPPLPLPPPLKTPLKGILRGTPIRPPLHSTPIRSSAPNHAPQTHATETPVRGTHHSLQMLSPAMSPIHAHHGEQDTLYDPHTTGGVMFEASDSSDISGPPRHHIHSSSPLPFLPHSRAVELLTNSSHRSDHSLSLADLHHLSYLDLSINDHPPPSPGLRSSPPHSSHPRPNDSQLTSSSSSSSSTGGLESLRTFSLLDITANTSHSHPHHHSKQRKSRKKKSVDVDRSLSLSHTSLISLSLNLSLSPCLVRSFESVRKSDSFLTTQRSSYPGFPPINAHVSHRHSSVATEALIFIDSCIHPRGRRTSWPTVHEPWPPFSIHILSDDQQILAISVRKTRHDLCVGLPQELVVVLIASLPLACFCCSVLSGGLINNDERPLSSH